jgi:hypothetical protein
MNSLTLERGADRGRAETKLILEPTAPVMCRSSYPRRSYFGNAYRACPSAYPSLTHVESRDLASPMYRGKRSDKLSTAGGD